MIPLQAIRNRRGEALPFLDWVERAAIPPETGAPYEVTREQVVSWLYALLAHYGLRVPFAPAEFAELAAQPEMVVWRLPVAYFRSIEDPNRYLRFDPLAWLAAMGLSS